MSLLRNSWKEQIGNFLSQLGSIGARKYFTLAGDNNKYKIGSQNLSGNLQFQVINAAASTGDVVKK